MREVNSTRIVPGSSRRSATRRWSCGIQSCWGTRDMVAIIGGGLSAIGNIAGGLIGSSAASSAAKQQQNVLNQILNFQKGILQQGQDNLAGNMGAATDTVGAYIADAVGALDNAGVGGITAIQNMLGPTIAAIQAGADRGINYLTGAGDNISNFMMPYITGGSNVMGQLVNEIQSGQLGAMPSLTDYSQLPGYQFTLSQGEQAARNAATASGYGGIGQSGSGPLGKSLIQYAEGLANTFGSQYLQNYWANQNNRYNILSNTATIGSNAGSNLGQILSNIYGNSSNIGTAYSNAGSGIANIFQNLGTGIADAYGTGEGNYVSAITQPLAAYMGLAGNVASSFGQAGVQGSANIANSQQAAGNLLGAGLTGGINSGISNYLLGNYLNQNNTGGSTIGSAVNAQPYTGGLY